MQECGACSGKCEVSVECRVCSLEHRFNVCSPEYCNYNVKYSVYM